MAGAASGGFVVTTMAASNAINANSASITQMPLAVKFVLLAMLGGALFCCIKAALIVFSKE